MCRSTAPPSADPPTITPLMPYVARKSKAHSEPLWIGCQYSTDSRSGAGTGVIPLRKQAPGNAYSAVHWRIDIVRLGVKA